MLEGGGREASPFFVKMKILTIAILLTLTACRTHATTMSEERHADTVGSLRSVATSTIDREMVWERVIMRPDSTGKLKVAERDIVRHTGKEIRAADSVASKQVSSTNTTDMESKETTADTAKDDSPNSRVENFFSIGFVWILLIGLVCVLGKYLLKSWRLKI